MMPKLTEMERKWIIYTPLPLPPYGFITGRNKVGNTTWAKLRDLIGQNRQNSFQ